MERNDGGDGGRCRLIPRTESFASTSAPVSIAAFSWVRSPLFAAYNSFQLFAPPAAFRSSNVFTIAVLRFCSAKRSGVLPP